MFTRWTISNFKSIREPISLDLAPLTIFSGINSSGKSTLIQSILMVAQSFMSVVDDEAIVLNGRFLQLGRLQDIIHYGNGDKPIEIGFDWLPTDELITPESIVIHVDTKIMKERNRRVNGRRTRKESPYVKQTKVAFAPIRQFRIRDNVPLQLIEVEATEPPPFSNTSILPPDIRQQVEEGVFDYRIVRPNPAGLVQDARLERTQHAALTNIVPTKLLVSIDAEMAQLISDTEWILDVLDHLSDSSRPNPRNVQDTPLSPQLKEIFKKITLSEFRSLDTGLSEFRHSIAIDADRLTRGWVLVKLKAQRYHSSELRDFRQHLAAALSEYLRDRSPKAPHETPTTYEGRLLPVEYMTPINQVQKIFSEQIYYLGPLRDDPRVIYAQPPLSEQYSVGLKGEYTAAKLNEYGNLIISYPLPPDEKFTGEYLLKRGKLIDAVILWLRRMGLVDSVETEETPKIGFRLTVNSPGLAMPLDLTSVGVGVSQVLPTLVLALLAPDDSVLIFEQPELHLHPKVQSVLGDFFLAISLMGKQCLIETHSEHLINRLRRRIVESREKTVLPKLRIYFAEKENAVSKFQEVKPNEFGTILEWPPGFFDEAENEASIILRMQMEKRRQILKQKQEQA